MRTTLLVSLALSVLAADAAAQDLLVTRHSPARIAKYSAADGSLIDDVFVDVDALLGLGGATQNLWDVEVRANGELWVSNYSTQLVYRFSGDGTAYLGDVGINPGRIVGFATDGDDLWAASVGGNVAAGAWSHDLVTGNGTNLVPATNIWDVELYGGALLLARSNGTVDRLDLSTLAVTTFAATGGFCEQIHVRAGGGLLVANFGNSGYDEIDAAGNITNSHAGLGAGSIRGVAELGNGNVLLNGTAGVWLFDPVAGSATSLSSGSGAFIGGGSGGFSSSVHCMSVANSTGAIAQLSGAGSNEIADNDVQLTADSLPANAFGFFLASRTSGFVANPGGSSGNLCLGGAIGRYVGPGQIQNSGAGGVIGLTLDLTAMPQPTGAVAAAPGDTWYFQAWYRDAVGAMATSNFTNGLEVGFN